MGSPENWAKNEVFLNFRKNISLIFAGSNQNERPYTILFPNANLMSGKILLRSNARLRGWLVLVVGCSQMCPVMSRLAKTFNRGEFG